MDYKLRNAIESIVLSLLIMLPIQGIADTLTLKSGRTIKATRCWEDGAFVKCELYGQTIGYHKNKVAKVSMDTAAKKPAGGFRFDSWNSGITVREAISIAETNNLPLHRDGLFSVNKKFNPKMCRPYADSATRFYYKDQIFSKWSTIRLIFSPASKRLSSINIGFSGIGISRKSDLRYEIESMLRQKYGNPIAVKKRVSFDDYDWTINQNATVAMKAGGNYVHVIYRDKAISDMADKEALEEELKGFTKTDRKKF